MATTKRAVKPERPARYMVLFSAHNSAVGFPSVQLEHPGYAVEPDSFTIIPPHEYDDIEANHYLEKLLNMGLLRKEWVDKLPPARNLPPPELSELKSDLQRAMEQLVKGKEKIAYEFTINFRAVDELSGNVREDVDYLLNDYLPALKVARTWLETSDYSWKDQRLGWIAQTIDRINGIRK